MKPQKTKVRKIVQKAQTPAQESKVERVMREFKEGKLKTPDGKIVTSREQAIAIAMHEAGISNKDLESAEIKNKLKVAKSALNTLIRKELAKDESIENQIIDFITANPELDDTMLHKFAEKLNIDPSEIETKIYRILSSFLAGGKSGGKKNQVDMNELKQGIQVETEHTGNSRLAEKIARDHLSEIPDYYSRLAKMEAEALKGIAKSILEDRIEKAKKVPNGTVVDRKDGKYRKISDGHWIKVTQAEQISEGTSKKSPEEQIKHLETKLKNPDISKPEYEELKTALDKLKGKEKEDMPKYDPEKAKRDRELYNRPKKA